MTLLSASALARQAPQSASTVRLANALLQRPPPAKYMFVGFHIYLCISQEPRRVPAPCVLLANMAGLVLPPPKLQRFQAPCVLLANMGSLVLPPLQLQPACHAQQGRTSMSRGPLRVSNVVRIPILFLVPLS